MKARILKKNKLYFPQVYYEYDWVGVARGGQSLYVNRLNSDDWCWHFTLWGAKKTLREYLGSKKDGEVVYVYDNQ